MKVRMLVSEAGPEESWKPGDIREVSAAVAQEWRECGKAVPVSGDSANAMTETADEVRNASAENAMKNKPVAKK